MHIPSRSVCNHSVAVVLLTLAFTVSGLADSCKEAQPRITAGYAALERADLGEAEKTFSAVKEAYPACNEVVLGLARVRAAAGNRRAAYQLFSRYLELAPKDARGFTFMAEFLLSAGDPRQADKLSARAVMLDGNDVKALILRGRILGMKGDAAAAERMLRKAATLSPKNPEPHFQLGVLFDRRQQNQRAADQFEQVIKLSPDDPRAYDYLALSLEPLGQFERAEWAYKKGLAVNRGAHFDAYLDYNYGRFLMKLNRLAEAGQHLDRAVKLAPATRAVHFEQAKLSMKRGNYQEARHHAERALKLKDPGGVILDLQVYYLLSRIYSHLGEKELAAKYTKLSQSSKVPASARMRGGR